MPDATAHSRRRAAAAVVTLALLVAAAPDTRAAADRAPATEPATQPATAHATTSAARPGRSFEPTASYQQRTIEGRTVRVSARLLRARPELAERTLDLLRVRLFEVNRVLPPAALAKLRDVIVWVELADPRFPGMCFHPSPHWLRDNGYNPEKAGDVEIGNAQNFLDWSREQPAMVLHELAHAYHHKVLGAGHPALRAAHRAAARGGRYDAVLRAGGTTGRAYALNNPEEFFAELTEAYFLTNDFYPFVRAELRQHDPASFDLIRTLWYDPAAATTAPATGQSRAHAEAAPAAR